MSKLSIPTPNATTTAVGSIELAGDLANTATSPQVTSTHLSAALPVAQGGTGVGSSTGTTNVVLSNSPTLVTPALGTPASGVLTNMTGLNSNGVDWTTAGNIWWQELGRTTLGSSGSSVSVTFTAKKYLQIRFSLLATGGTIMALLQFNSDTASNYSVLRSNSFGGSGSAASSTSIIVDDQVGAWNKQGVIDIVNITAQEKITNSIAGGSGTAGAGNTPQNTVSVGKWANTANQITTVKILMSSGTGSYNTNSEVVVLGHD